MRSFLKRKMGKINLPFSDISSLGWLFSAFLAVTLLTVIYFASETVRDQKKLNSTWLQFNDDVAGRLNTLNGLRQTIGFGGFIQNFKKFLIQHDAETFDAALKDLRRADSYIEDYHIMAKTVREHEALNDISTVLEDYQSALLKAARLWTEQQIRWEASEATNFNDLVAFEALKDLDQEVAKGRELFKREVARQFTSNSENAVAHAAIITLLLSLTITGLIFVLQFRLCRPLNRIAKAIKNYSDEKFIGGLPERNRRDEIGNIVRILEVWRQSARGKAALHQELEKSVSTMDLMNEIAIAANEAHDKHSAFAKCFRMVCEFYGWQIGHLWELKKDSANTLQPINCWYFEDTERFSSFWQATNDTTFEIGQGLPGTVYKTGSVTWMTNINNEDNFPRIEPAQECGLIGGVGAPIKIQDEVVAIMEFFSVDEIKETSDMREVLTHIGTQMGRVEERDMWAQDAIEHTDHLQDLVDNATAELRSKADELRTALEKEQELNELQRQFVSMASHEFRTPLAIIDSSAQKLQRRKERLDADDLVKRTDKIRAAVVRMTTLMESTLSAARMESGKLDVKTSDCDLALIVQTVCERQRELSAQHKIELDLDDLPNTVNVDPNAVEQIFTNLLSNAVKYSPDANKIKVCGSREGDTVFVAVTDFGLGIDESELPQMFTRFFRATTSTGIAGTGIGLSIVKMLAEAHGGDISVKSKKGEGSTFTLRLPIDGPATLLEEIPEREIA